MGNQRETHGDFYLENMAGFREMLNTQDEHFIEKNVHFESGGRWKSSARLSLRGINPPQKNSGHQLLTFKMTCHFRTCRPQPAFEGGEQFVASCKMDK